MLDIQYVLICLYYFLSVSCHTNVDLKENMAIWTGTRSQSCLHYCWGHYFPNMNAHFILIHKYRSLSPYRHTYVEGQLSHYYHSMCTIPFRTKVTLR